MGAGIIEEGFVVHRLKDTRQLAQLGLHLTLLGEESSHHLGLPPHILWQDLAFIFDKGIAKFDCFAQTFECLFFGLAPEGDLID